MRSTDFWKFTCLRSDQDYARKGLNPRTEIRLLQEYPLSQRYQFNISISIDQFPVSYEFLQVMTYLPKALPLLQLEFIDNQIGVRYREAGQLWRKPLVPATLLKRTQIQLKMDFPCIVIMINGKIMFSYCLKNQDHIKNNSFWIQFGVYKNKQLKVDQSVNYHTLDLYKL
jgi:hypothetical protein